jgi:hypothetical protein
MESCPTVIMTDPWSGLIPADQGFSLLEFEALAIPLAHMNNDLSYEATPQ